MTVRAEVTEEKSSVSVPELAFSVTVSEPQLSSKLKVSLPEFPEKALLAEFPVNVIPPKPPITLAKSQTPPVTPVAVPKVAVPKFTPDLFGNPAARFTVTAVE